MGFRGFDRQHREKKTFDRAVFRHRFDTVETVTDWVKQVGRQVDERLPRLYEQREKQRENAELLRIVGGEPLEKVQDELWRTNHQIEYDEPWQMLRDCLAADLVKVEITTLYVQFEVAGYRDRRICRFGPHAGLEFGQTGQLRQLTELAKTARAVLQRRSRRH